MIKKMLLRDLIDEINTLDESLNLMLPKGEENINLSTWCLIADDEEIDCQSTSIDYLYIFDLSTLKDILENLREQKKEYTCEQALGAINFYIKNDAFIEMDSKTL